MPSLDRHHRSLLEKAVLKARELAEKGAHEALITLGVDQPQPLNHLDSGQHQLRDLLRARGRQLGDGVDASGRQELRRLVEVVAYEHWHRMLFARFLAENGLLLEPEYQVPVSLAEVEELAREEGLDVWELAGRYAQRMLPEVFRMDDPVLALPLAREICTRLEKLLSELPRAVFCADDSLGWTYQFWQSQRKDEINISVKAGAKVGADEISPVTQLFTEDYMVEFLLHNMLGAWWTCRMGAIIADTEEEARAKVGLSEREGLKVEWTYLRFVQVGQTKRWIPAAGTFSGWPKQVKEFTFLDPCMGSGHFLVFALPLMARLRMEEENLSASEAVFAVLRDNLHGLELDERCTQIAAFNLAFAAWRLGGYQTLPSLHLACSGLAPNSTEQEWIALAGDHADLQSGMARLHRLFQAAPVLGSLIDPEIAGDDPQGATFHELQPLLEQALQREDNHSTNRALAITARGLAKAAAILEKKYTIVATNVPYLGRSKQLEVMKAYCREHHPDSAADLAACFVDRLISLCVPQGAVAVVKPQNILFLRTYASFRRRYLNGKTLSLIVKLGAKAFHTPMWDFGVTLSIFENIAPELTTKISGLDIGDEPTPEKKALQLSRMPIFQGLQRDQLDHPDAAIVFHERSPHKSLSHYADSLQGASLLDMERFRRYFWEIEKCGDWILHQSTPDGGADYSGLEFVSIAREPDGEFEKLAKDLKAEKRLGGANSGHAAWGKAGIACSWMGTLPAAIYTGQVFDNSIAAIIPKDEKHLPAIYAFVRSEEYHVEVRKINQKTQVANATLVAVPFDLNRWKNVADREYPSGLPKPHSTDPTQWLFHGHPKDSEQPLHVAVVRLLGYQWPRQTGSRLADCPAIDQDDLEAYADAEGIVCLTPIHGKPAAADRLRALLSAALGDYDEQALISATRSKLRDIETWLRDEFFEQHCVLFHHHPFIWHIWDGRKDGFHVLVNYHKLCAPGGAGRKLLETLAYTYLGDWIRKQHDAIKRDESGAEDRLIAAQSLQRELAAILAGEPPYDLFVRWKSLSQQPIGWEPDINDGIRVNIRPFMLARDMDRKGAGLLRAKPNLKWDRDRGREPLRNKTDYPWFWNWDEKIIDFTSGSEYDGNRWSACHYTTTMKRIARERLG